MSADFLVIIPTYRRPKFLPGTILSALGQSGVNVKVVVVDDCPEGSAETQVKALADPRIIYLKNPEPSGGWPSRVRNRGFNYAASANIPGEFVHFLDDDDIVPEGHYASVAQIFAAHKDIGVVFGIVATFIEPSDDKDIRVLQEKALQHEKYCFDKAAKRASTYCRIASRVPVAGDKLLQFLFTTYSQFGHPMFVCSAAVIRRKSVAEIHGFDPQMRLMEDNEFYTRAIRHCGVYFTGKPSINYRVGSASALMHSLVLSEEEKLKEYNEIQTCVAQKKARLKKELGLRFYTDKILFFTVVNPRLALKRIRLKLLRLRGINPDITVR